MSKPKDIPQDVWDKAYDVLSETRTAAVVEGLDFVIIREGIARAIMAAKAEEREQCAQVADLFELERPGDQLEFIDKHSGYNWDAGFDAGCTLAARAIRKRGEG